MLREINNLTTSKVSVVLCCQALSHALEVRPDEVGDLGDDTSEQKSIQDVERFIENLPAGFRATTLEQLQQADVAFQSVRSNLTEMQATTSAKLRFGSGRVEMVIKAGSTCRFNEEEQLLKFQVGLGFYYSCAEGDCASLLDFVYQDEYVIAMYEDESRWHLAWLMFLTAELAEPAGSNLVKKRCLHRLFETISNGNPYVERVLRQSPTGRATPDYPAILPGRDVDVVPSCSPLPL
jgi:hypothetical protein